MHKAQELHTVNHYAASSLDARTLRACVSHLPDIFLAGVGYNRQEIDCLRALYAEGESDGPHKDRFHYLSCTLACYIWEYAFVDRLQPDLIKNGVNCRKNYNPPAKWWLNDMEKL